MGKRLLGTSTTSRRHTDRHCIVSLAVPAGHQTPHLAVGIFHTTYTYYNTLAATATAAPVVLTTRHTVTNTLTAPDDYLSMLLLQPSRPPLAHTAHTYVARIVRTETLPAGATRLVTDTHTQVVVTESLPAAAAVAVHATPPPGAAASAAAAATLEIRATRTLLTTYTYLTTVYRSPAVPETRSSTLVERRIVTERVPAAAVPSAALSALAASLSRLGGGAGGGDASTAVVSTVATLLDGQPLEITAALVAPVAPATAMMAAALTDAAAAGAPGQVMHANEVRSLCEYNEINNETQSVRSTTPIK